MAYNPLTTPIIYERNKKLQPLKLSNGLYKIETIPVGAFVKDNAKTGDAHERIAFEVDDNLLKHWKETLKSMQYNGVEVPMPLNHTEDPEARRATVVDFEIGKNSEGNNSLYTIFKPKNEKVIEDLKDASVSIYVPPKFVDGRGNEYHYPIKHVCFTDYPVIAGMKKMEPYAGLPEGAIAASYVETKKEKSKMAVKPGEKEKEKENEHEYEEGEKEGEEKEIHAENEENEEHEDEGGDESCPVTVEAVRAIAEKLGLEGIPDDKLIPALNHVIDAILESVNEGDDEHGGGENKEKGVGPVAHRIEHKEEHYHPPGGGNMPIAAGFISIGRKSRLAEINAAAKDGYITPAIRNDLIRDFCSDDALQLAFSPEGDVLDNFDQTMNLIRKNGKVVKLNSERSQNDGLQLSYSDVFNNENANPLLRDANRRAKEAGQI